MKGLRCSCDVRAAANGEASGTRKLVCCPQRVRRRGSGDQSSLCSHFFHRAMCLVLGKLLPIRHFFLLSLVRRPAFVAPLSMAVPRRSTAPMRSVDSPIRKWAAAAMSSARFVWVTRMGLPNKSGTRRWLRVGVKPDNPMASPMVPSLRAVRWLSTISTPIFV